jgi:hypothetical protein
LRFYARCYNQTVRKQHICCKHRNIFSFLYLHALKVNLLVLKEPNANNEEMKYKICKKVRLSFDLSIYSFQINKWKKKY